MLNSEARVPMQYFLAAQTLKFPCIWEGGNLIQGSTEFCWLTCCDRSFAAGIVAGTLVSSSSIACISPPHAATFSKDLSVEVKVSFNGQQFESGVIAGTRNSLAIILRYYTIITLTPSFGPAMGGTVLSINGTNLFPVGSCAFRSPGKQRLTSSLGGSLSRIQCTSPPLPASLVSAMSQNGLDVNFTISMYAEDDSNTLTYRFTAPLILQSILPQMGPVEGNYSISLFGSGMLRTLTCVFQQASSSTTDRASWRSSTLALCLVPPYKRTRLTVSTFDMNIVLINNFVQEETSTVFQYYEAVKVLPCGGPMSGGTRISVQLNRNISLSVSLRNATCRFDTAGSVPARIAQGDRSKLVCISPPNPPHQLSMNVSLDNVLFTQQSLPFIAYVEPSIVRIRPNSGPVQGGTIVTVIGRDFLPNGLRNDAASSQVVCRFGERPQSALLGDDAGGPLFWSETVAQPLGSGAALRWVCLSPKFTSVYGNLSKLNLSYSNYSVPISLTFDGQYYTTDAVNFNYFQMLSLLPSLGPLDGQTMVTIMGPNLGESLNEGRDMACLWNGEILVQAYLIGEVNRRLAACASPAKPSNLFSMLISLEIRLNNVKNAFTLDQLSFLYYKDPQVIRMAPSSAPRMGGVSLLVSGLYFFDHELLRCRFNASGITKARYNYSLFAVECPIPRYLQGTPISFLVSISLNAQQYGNLGNKDATNFHYYGMNRVTPVAAALSIKSLNLTLDGTNLKLYEAFTLPLCIASIQVIETSNLTNTTNIMYIQKQSSQAMAFDATTQSVICPIPTFMQDPAAIYLDIDLGQVTIVGSVKIRTADRLKFTFYSDSAVTVAIDPSLSQISGGIRIRVIGSGFMDSGSLVCQFRNSAVSATVIARYISSTVVSCLTPSIPFVSYPNSAHMFSRHFGEYTIVNAFLSLDAGRTVLQRGLNCTIAFLPQAQMISVSPQQLPAIRSQNLSVRVYGSALAGSPYLACMLQFSSPPSTPSTAPCVFEDGCGNVSDAFVPTQLSAGSTYSADGLTTAQRNLCVYLLVSIPTTWVPKSSTLSLHDFQILSTVDGQSYTSSSFRLSFFTIGSIVPSSGPSSSNTTVTVFGSNLGVATQQISCRFGANVLRGSLQTSSTIICVVPGLSPGTHATDIQVSKGFSSSQAPWTEVGLPFLSYLDPVISGLEPSSGRNDLPHNITVFGDNFAGQMLCRIKTNVSILVYNFIQISRFALNQSGIGMCVGIPSLRRITGFVTIELTRNGIQWSSGKRQDGSYKPEMFLFFELPSMLSLVPFYG
jgi:hypothetical protein